MRRKALAALAGLALGLGALECASGAAPKSQCQNGSHKSETVRHHPVRYTCHNNEWVRDK